MAVMNEMSTLLNAATGTGAGSSSNLFSAYATFTFYKRVVGTFTALVVNYEGSLDGTNWFQLGTDSTLVATATFVVDKPCRYVRANVTSFTGGTNVSVDMIPLSVA